MDDEHTSALHCLSVMGFSLYRFSRLPLDSPLRLIVSLTEPKHGTEKKKVKWDS